jgi:hypothetical protein
LQIETGSGKGRLVPTIQRNTDRRQKIAESAGGLQAFSYLFSVWFPRGTFHSTQFKFLCYKSCLRGSACVCGRCDCLFRPAPLHCISLTARYLALHFGAVPMISVLFCKLFPFPSFLQRLVRVYPPAEMETSAFHKIQPRLFYRSTNFKKAKKDKVKINHSSKVQSTHITK